MKTKKAHPKSFPKGRTLKTALICLFLLPSLWEGPGMGLFAQNVSINSTGALPNASAILDIDASPGNNKGLLIPRVTFAERTGANFNPLTAAAQGLLVYQTNAGGEGEGYYYNTSTTTTPAWVKLFTNTTGWSLTGNSGLNAATNFLGTTDNVPLVLRTNALERMRVDTITGNVGIGTTMPNANAVLELSATNKGLMTTRLTTVQRTAMVLAAADNGLIVYDNDLNSFYYWDGAVWKSFGSGSGSVHCYTCDGF